MRSTRPPVYRVGIRRSYDKGAIAIQYVRRPTDRSEAMFGGNGIYRVDRARKARRTIANPPQEAGTIREKIPLRDLDERNIFDPGSKAAEWRKTVNHDIRSESSKSGNGRLRGTLIQLAWLWIRHQPGSDLTKWFRDRVERNGGRMKKTMITALARKLLVALWKYATAGVVIEGAAVRA